MTGKGGECKFFACPRFRPPPIPPGIPQVLRHAGKTRRREFLDVYFRSLLATLTSDLYFRSLLPIVAADRYFRRPKTPTPVGVATYTFPFAIMGVMNLSPAPK